MTNEQRQELFDYFDQEYGIGLLDGDFNEIEYILNPQPLLTDEEIEKEANTQYLLHNNPSTQDQEYYNMRIKQARTSFIVGAKFTREKLTIK